MLAVILSPVTAPDVFEVSHWFEMFWIDASSVSTKVVYAQAFWYWSYQSFIDDTVSPALFVWVDRDASISPVVLSSRVEPASVFENLNAHQDAEMCCDCLTFSWHVPKCKGSEDRSLEVRRVEVGFNDLR